MKCLGFFLAFSLLRTEIQVLEPQSLISSLEGDGKLNYVTSTFGELLYSERLLINLVMPPPTNIEGCNSFTAPQGFEGRRYAWLLKRGTCTYSKKAFEAQRSGAYAIIVYYNQPNTDIQSIIPISDSVCKIKRQQHQNSSDSDIA